LRIVPRSAMPTASVIIGPEASKFAAAGIDLCPSAGTLAMLVDPRLSCAAEQLEPVYLRETSFVKAPPPRHIDTSE
jgi:hypothetical protein